MVEILLPCTPRTFDTSALSTSRRSRNIGRAGNGIDAIGTGSFLPGDWQQTYATADIVEYGGTKRVKVGREFLLQK